MDISLDKAPFVYRWAGKFTTSRSVFEIDESGNGGRNDEEDEENGHELPVRGAIGEDFVLIGRDDLGFPAIRDGLAIPLLGHGGASVT